MLRLFEAGLAAWRLARMLVSEAGPNNVFADLRTRTGIEYSVGGPVSWPSWNPLHCVYCTSMYTAVLVLLVPRWARTVLAVSAVVALLEEVSTCLQGMGDE